MKPAAWLMLAGLLGAAGVGLGAYGAHGLDAYLVGKYLPAGAAENPGGDNLAGEAPATGAGQAQSPQQMIEAAPPEVQANLRKRLENFETAVRYQMWHTLALVGVAAVAAHRRSTAANVAGFCFLLGIALFCGMLYFWAFGGPQFLVHIVPFGGVSFIVGWLALAFSGRGWNT